MSEYQCYEFVALGRPLTARQMAGLPVISTRAEISPTRFWNAYQWGDLEADPAKLMERLHILLDLGSETEEPEQHPADRTTRRR